MRSAAPPPPVYLQALYHALNRLHHEDAAVPVEEIGPRCKERDEEEGSRDAQDSLRRDGERMSSGIQPQPLC